MREQVEAKTEATRHARMTSMVGLSNLIALAALAVSIAAIFIPQCMIDQVENRLYEGEGKARIYRAFAEFDYFLRNVDSLKADSLRLGLSAAAARGASVPNDFLGQSEVKKVLHRLQNRIENRWEDVEIEVKYTQFALGIPRGDVLGDGPLEEFEADFVRLRFLKDSVIQNLYDVGEGLTHVPLR